jgi:hypothetical protein
VPEVDRAYCRAAARECVAQALIVVDLDKKEALFARAQEWLRLAYANSDAEFERLLVEFNERQLGGDPTQPPPPPIPPVQHQPIQQQQQKKKEDDK